IYTSSTILQQFIHCDAMNILLPKPTLNFLASLNTIQAAYNLYVFYFKVEKPTNHLMKQIIIHGDMSFFIFPNLKHKTVSHSIQRLYLRLSKWLFSLNLSMGKYKHFLIKNFYYTKHITYII